jgi:hypothetical protein
MHAKRLVNFCFLGMSPWSETTTDSRRVHRTSVAVPEKPRPTRLAKSDTSEGLIGYSPRLPMKGRGGTSKASHKRHTQKPALVSMRQAS